jgi:prevent-host-death family protein
VTKGVNRGQREAAALVFPKDFDDLSQLDSTSSRSRLSVICQSRPNYPILSYNLSYMRKSTVSVRELQQNLKRVMARVERGEIVEVTRRDRPVARLTPATSVGPVSDWPDLDARTRAVFGDRVLSPGGSDTIIDARGER